MQAPSPAPQTAHNQPASPPRPTRTARPDPAPDSFAVRVRDTMARLSLDEPRAAAYLGVPVFTVRKWISGEREPNAAVVRLFDVLGMVEALAPALHDSLMPSTQSVTPRKRGRVARPI
jgi:hypothetical protein